MAQSRDKRIADLQDIIRRNLNIEPPEPDVDVIDQGLLDSLALVELLFAIEHEIGVEIPLDRLDLDDLRSITSMASLIERCEGEAAVDAGHG